MRLGFCVSSSGLSFRNALPQAARMGVQGVQLDAVGDFHPDRLTDTGCREVLNLLRSYNLQLTALNCPLRRAIDVAEDQEERIDYIRAVMNLAFTLGPRVVIMPCPPIPSEEETVRANLLREALLALGQHGDRIGTLVALEIGFDSGEKVRDFLQQFDVGSLGVNYDPANLLLHGHDPARNLIPLSGKIVHTHARDARRATVSRSAQEVPLGAGDVEWLGYFAVLTSLEYRGWVVIERESSDNRLADIASGVSFLRRMIIPS